MMYLIRFVFLESARKFRMLGNQNIEINNQASISGKELIPKLGLSELLNSETSPVPETVDTRVENKQQQPIEKTCEWEGCHQKFNTLKDFVLHVNNHVSALDWEKGYFLHFYTQRYHL
jgi:hypothetical protein